MHDIKVTRRVFIGAAVYLVSAPLLVTMYHSEVEIIKVINDGQFFTSQELTVLADVAEIMIPKTDTPGATDVNVSSVLDGLMVTWAGNKTKKQFRSALMDIENLAAATHQNNYVKLPLHHRKELLVALDKQAFTNIKAASSAAYRHLKEMIFHIYYTSEQANRDFVLIPGGYRGDITKKELDAIKVRGYL